MEEDSRTVEKTHGEQESELQDEGFGGESGEEDENEINKLESDASSASDLSNNRWTEILEDVQPVAPILLENFPSMAIRYKLIINELKAFIRDLPLSRDLLPTNIRICKSTIRFLQKERKKKLWKSYTNKVVVQELENSLKLLFSNMVSIAIELKVDSEIIRNEASYAANQNKKQTAKNTNIPADKGKDEDNKKKLKTNYDDKVDKSTNRWMEMLEEVQPVAPILMSKFPSLSYKYDMAIEWPMQTIQTLPLSRYLLPIHISSCKQLVRLLRKEKKKGLWDDFANITVELEQLENSLRFLFSKMVSIAIELKVKLS